MEKQIGDVATPDVVKSNDSGKKKNNKKTIIWVVVIITAIICICCTISSALGYTGASKLADQSNEVKSELLIDMCNNEGIVTRSEYRSWFSADFREDHSMMDAADTLDEIFPDDMVCDELYVDGIVDLFKKQQSFSYNVSTTDGTYADLTYPVADNESISLHLIKVDSDWKLNSYLKTYRSHK